MLNSPVMLQLNIATLAVLGGLREEKVATCIRSHLINELVGERAGFIEEDPLVQYLYVFEDCSQRRAQQHVCIFQYHESDN